jgi:hypothetical protein
MKFVNFGLSFLNKNIQLSTIFQLYREILLKVALDTIKQTNKQTVFYDFSIGIWKSGVSFVFYLIAQF